ncbi:MAG: hypothetical protein O3A00_24245, partial [Planctomycetota bacterium]|nr:hypothetical protein [Planctomycetota bacterium]
VLAVGAANASESFLQTAALEKGRHRLFDDRPRPASGCPAILGLITPVVDLLEDLVGADPITPRRGGQSGYQK